jgi:dephospho-CoA kinase
LISDDEKAKRADFVYVNDGTIEQLDAFVSGVIGKLTRR